MSGYVAELRGAIREFTPLLQRMSDDATRKRPQPGKSCPREIIGHLIDSASNNHSFALHTTRPSVHPIGDENVRLVRIGVVTVRSPDDFLAVAAEHGKSVEGRCRRHLLESCPVGIDQKQIEIAKPRISVVIR